MGAIEKQIVAVAAAPFVGVVEQALTEAARVSASGDQTGSHGVRKARDASRNRAHSS